MNSFVPKVCVEGFSVHSPPKHAVVCSRQHKAHTSTSSPPSPGVAVLLVTLAVVHMGKNMFPQSKRGVTDLPPNAKLYKVHSSHPKLMELICTAMPDVDVKPPTVSGPWGSGVSRWLHNPRGRVVLDSAWDGTGGGAFRLKRNAWRGGIPSK